MPCSDKLSLTLQTEILSTETSDFLKQMIILKSFSGYTVEFQEVRADMYIFCSFFVATHRKKSLVKLTNTWSFCLQKHVFEDKMTKY